MKKVTAVTLVSVISSIVINALFLACTKWRDDISSSLSASFKHVQVNASVRVSSVLLARPSCVAFSVIFMRRATSSRCYSQLSAEIFDLKSQRTATALCSWSRNNAVSFHHVVPRRKSPVHPSSDSGVSVRLAVGRPPGFKDTLK